MTVTRSNPFSVLMDSHAPRKIPLKVRKTLRPLLYFFFNPTNSERMESEFLKSSLRHGDSVIEIGANIGGSLPLISSIVGHSGSIISLEPNPASVRILCRTARFLPNVTVVNAAAGNLNGAVEFTFEDAFDVVGSMLETNHKSQDSKKVRVQCIRVDDLVGKLGIPKVDCLVIDAEGSELDVLFGARNQLKSLRVIIVEIHDYIDLDLKNKVHALLVQNDFVLVKSLNLENYDITEVLYVKSDNPRSA